MLLMGIISPTFVLGWRGCDVMAVGRLLECHRSGAAEMDP